MKAFFYLTGNVARHKSLSMEKTISMCYGLSTIKVQGHVVAVTLKTKVNEYAKKNSFAYLAWKKIKADNKDLIRINPGRLPYTHTVSAVATGDNMSRLYKLVNQAAIMQLEAQLAFRKGDTMPEWVTYDHPF